MNVFFDADQQLHHPQNYFSRGKMRTPEEVPMRSDAILQAVKSLGWAVEKPADQGWGPIEAVHDHAYLAFLRDAHSEWVATGQDWGNEVMSNVYRRSEGEPLGILAKAAHFLADGSCPIGPNTARSAYAAAQSAVAAADAVAAGAPVAFALARPPGHHARADAAGGFCYLNNAAIAAQRLRETCQRVVVLDIDMHHGQGIQEIFYHRDDIFYISIHGDPLNFYPVVSGHASEVGEGVGTGFNLNIPLPHGSDAATFFQALDQALVAANKFAPQAMVLAMGFDTYREDPQSKMTIDTPDFATMAQRLVRCGWPTAIVFEGGYHAATLQHNAQTFLQHWQR